jgi:hypothetical protein
MSLKKIMVIMVIVVVIAMRGERGPGFSGANVRNDTL